MKVSNVAVGIAYSEHHESKGVCFIADGTKVWMSVDRARLYGELILKCVEALEEENEVYESEEEELEDEGDGEDR